jgi:hypothetical protein
LHTDVEVGSFPREEGQTLWLETPNGLDAICRIANSKNRRQSLFEKFLEPLAMRLKTVGSVVESGDGGSLQPRFPRRVSATFVADSSRIDTEQIVAGSSGCNFRTAPEKLADESPDSEPLVVGDLSRIPLAHPGIDLTDALQIRL